MTTTAFTTTRKIPVNPATQARLLVLHSRLGGSYASVIDQALAHFERSLCAVAPGSASDHVQHKS